MTIEQQVASEQFEALREPSARRAVALTPQERAQAQQRREEQSKADSADYARRAAQGEKAQAALAERKATEYVPGAVPDALVQQILKRVVHPESDVTALRRYHSELIRLRDLDGKKFSDKAACKAAEKETADVQAAIRAGQVPPQSKGLAALRSEYELKRRAISSERKKLMADNEELLARMRQQRFVSAAEALRVELEKKLPALAELGIEGSPVIAALKRVPAWVAHMSGPEPAACPMLKHLLK